ncbi:MAG: YjbQ family protein [Oscillospiraceae bacterium]|nr:YjbQ family protein [Oscillospiraceae bacterium]
MKIHSEKVSVTTQTRPTFHDVTPDVKRVLESAGIKNGLLTVYSQHTTCSVFIQEPSAGSTFNDTLYIMQDLVNALDKIAPTCRYEGQYLHPGKDHIVRAQAIGEDPAWSLNTDAHLRSAIIGRSVSIPIIDGDAQLGRFGHVWFADFDQVRAREREILIHIMGE